MANMHACPNGPLLEHSRQYPVVIAGWETNMDNVLQASVVVHGVRGYGGNEE